MIKLSCYLFRDGRGRRGGKGLGWDGKVGECVCVGMNRKVGEDEAAVGEGQGGAAEDAEGRGFKRYFRYKK